MREEYNKNKFHGNIATDSKCYFSWQSGDFCLHQVWEIIINKVKPEFIIKRDFKRKKMKIEKSESIFKKIDFIHRLERFLTLYRHYEFGTLEILRYIVERLGFKVVISKKRKLIRLKKIW